MTDAYPWDARALSMEDCVGKGVEVGCVVARGSGNTLNNLGVLVKRCGYGMGREEDFSSSLSLTE